MYVNVESYKQLKERKFKVIKIQMQLIEYSNIVQVRT